ncbi:hypothetical protein ACGF3G_35315 [Streptomyces sp. NPDC048179]|uniref:hypothetical protein n=1 Tax=Streptomyces sp. NPDC048179 TaxID=3365506 RepID=UPI0037172B1E
MSTPPQQPPSSPQQPQPPQQQPAPPAPPEQQPAPPAQPSAQPPAAVPQPAPPPQSAPPIPPAQAAQPTAYPYPNPQSPPPPQNPYAQPTLVNQPAPPPQANPYAPQPGYGYPPVAPPPPGGGGGKAGQAVLWAAVGAVVASAAWAAGVFLTGGFGDSADLRGYQAPANLCSGADYSSFKDEYPEDDSSPTKNALKDPALDESYCSLSLKKTGSSYGDAYLTLQVDLHKKTDPGPEFTATWKNYGDSHTDYDVSPVSGIGDEAYLVTEDTSNGSSTSGSRYATLAVRDGWMTYTMSYSAYFSSYDNDTDPPTLDDVTGWLKTDTKSTLEQLKS